MNKKGFTLIELLVVVILIAAMVLLVLPNITNSVKNYGTNIDKTTFKIIKEATKLYISDNENLFMKTNENTYCVTLNELVEENYLKNTIEYNSKDITNTHVMKVTYENGFNYELVNKNDCQTMLLSSRILGVNNKNVVSSGDGLYVSTATNDGSPTYYYRGNLVNNYVEFAGKTWRIVRVNEDGTIRLILQEGLNDNTAYKFYPSYNNYIYMYYSGSNVTNGMKNTIDTWYTSTLADDYDSYISTTNFCESAKVKHVDSYASGNATMELYTNYAANFECSMDGNNKQYVNAKAGLITVDEVLMAGLPIYYSGVTASQNNYLINNVNYWTISPAGTETDCIYAYVWYVSKSGYITRENVSNVEWECGGIADWGDPLIVNVRPVISLNANVTVEESNGNGVHGSSTNPYVIKTN